MAVFVPATIQGLGEAEHPWTYLGELVAIQRIQHRSEFAERTVLQVPAWSLAASVHGTWIIGKQVLAAGHMAIFRPGDHAITICPGSSTLILKQWHARAMPWLEGFLSTRVPGVIKVAPGVTFTEQGSPEAMADARALSQILVSLTEILDSETALRLRPPTVAEAHAFAPLIQSIEHAPTEPWHLKEAAEKAGYSPFHFSRTFKQVVGCGFHEYVDRTRTEIAVELLLQGTSIADAASKAGFSSSRSLRESLRDYLGLLPADLQGNA